MPTETPKLSPQNLSKSDWLLILFGAFALFFGSGWHYLASNQQQYLLFALHNAYAEFQLPADWYTHNTTEYHIVFGYFSWFLGLIGPLKITSIAANALCYGMLSTGLLLIARFFSKTRHSILFLLTLLWILAAKNTDAGLGQLYVWGEYLQPTQVAGTMLVLALGLLLDRRYLSAGIMAAVSGSFHASFMLSSTPVFALFIIREQLWKNRSGFLRFVTPVILLYGIISIAVLITLINHPPSNADAVNIFIHFRCPHHNLITHWNVIQSLIWTVFTLFGGIVLFSQIPGTSEIREIKTLWIGLMIMTAIGVLFAGIIDVPQINTAMLWRLAPIAFLLSLMALEIKWIDFFMRQPLSWNKRSLVFGITFIIVSLSWIYRENELEFSYRMLWLLAIPAGAWLHRHLEIPKNLTRSVTELLQRRITVLLIVCISAVTVLGFTQRSTIWRPMPPNLSELVAWADNNTPDSAIFVVPPSYEYANLRVRGHKALVVDLKTCPMLLPEIEEWYQRIQDVTGVLPGMRRSQSYYHYQKMDADRIQLIKEKYGATHIVMDNHRPVEYLKQMTPVYNNDGYSVYAIP